jgi:hypothetical protein
MTKLENRCSNCGGKFGLVSHHYWGLQSLQVQLPCENGEGLCVHEKVAWLITSRRFVGDEPALAVDAAKRGLTAATINPRSWLLRATSISPTGNPPARGKGTGTLRLRAKS